MAQLRRPRTVITYQKLMNRETSSIFSDPVDLVAGDRNNPVTLTVEEMEVLLLIREDLLKKKDMKTKVKKGVFPARAEMARLTRRPESKFKEIYDQLQKKGVLMIESNYRQYQVGKNCANAFAFIRDRFADEDKKQIEQYFAYSRSKRQGTLLMKKTLHI